MWPDLNPRLLGHTSYLNLFRDNMALYSQGIWQEDEHQRFLDALKRFPQGPWAEIARWVGTRSPRQVQTHAQKYYEKIERHARGLQRDRRGSVRTQRTRERRIGAIGATKEHEIDHEILAACSRALELGERLPTPAKLRKSEPTWVEGETAAGGFERDSGSVEENGSDDLLPLDKSLDFLIHVLADLDDQAAQWAWSEAGGQCGPRGHEEEDGGTMGL